jgi:hypothetical protein
MPRTPEQTNQATRLMHRHWRTGLDGTHVPAPPEIAERLRQVVDDISAALECMDQVAIDMDEDGRHNMGWEVHSFSLNVGWYFHRDGDDGYLPAQDRLRQILNGTWEDHTWEPCED